MAREAQDLQGVSPFSRRLFEKATLPTRPTLAVISPARPESAKTDSSPLARLIPSKAAASEEARHTLRYVAPLNDVRTLPADFFSMLLVDQRRDFEGFLNQAIARKRL